MLVAMHGTSRAQSFLRAPVLLVDPDAQWGRAATLVFWDFA